MVEELLFGERLLDEQQTELVEAFQLVAMLDSVGSVGVHLKRNALTELLPHRSDRLDVPARLDLELDALVTVCEVARDGSEKSGDRFVDADGHSAVDRFARGAEVAAERDALGPELGIEYSHLEGRLRHSVPDDVSGRGCNPSSCERLLPKQPRKQMHAYHVLCSVYILGGVDGILQGDTLTPALPG